MAEILAGNGIQNAFNDLGIEAKMTYKSNHEPYYEVWEVNKKDLKMLEETPMWYDAWGWYRNARGSNMSTPFEFLTVTGQFMIGWETQDGKDTYDSLLDYFYSGLGITQVEDICALSVDLGRANGKNMSGLFGLYEG